MSTGPLKFDFPKVPTTSYGNNLKRPERPGDLKARPYMFERHCQFFPALDPVGQKSSTGVAGGVSLLFRPKMLLLPMELIRDVKLDPGQVHALNVGVGRKSMDDRWMGKLIFQQDGSAIIGLWRTWGGSQIFELTFQPIDPPLPSPTSSSPISYTEPPLKSLPPQFPHMVLTGLRHESHPKIYAPSDRLEFPTVVGSGKRISDKGEGFIRSELKESLGIVGLLLKMRLGIDDGTWLTY
ncbi:hypothetical protein CF319_g2338 [Tilletia indica]|nr:hypothetical protein CF319_g2338 [Tilletia indica]